MALLLLRWSCCGGAGAVLQLLLRRLLRWCCCGDGAAVVALALAPARSANASVAHAALDNMALDSVPIVASLANYMSAASFTLIHIHNSRGGTVWARTPNLRPPLPASAVSAADGEASCPPPPRATTGLDIDHSRGAEASFPCLRPILTPGSGFSAVMLLVVASPSAPTRMRSSV